MASILQHILRSIDTYQDLHQLFQQQVTSDNTDLNVDSAYLPNPVFTTRPSYCLLAMEPSTMRKPLVEFKGMIDNGFMNFIETEETLILQYCAFKYLCSKSFEFAITDISKGAMPPSLAKKYRPVVWSRWRHLLEAELKFLGNPRVIAIGGKVAAFLRANRLPFSASIWHYSGANRNWNNFGSIAELELFGEDFREELRAFAIEVLNRLQYNPTRRRMLYNRIFAKSLTIRQKRLLLYYSGKFQAMINV